MTPMEQLAEVLPDEAILYLAQTLLAVDHAGETVAVIHHDQDGRVTDVEIAPAVRKIRVRRRRP